MTNQNWLQEIRAALPEGHLVPPGHYFEKCVAEIERLTDDLALSEKLGCDAQAAAVTFENDCALMKADNAKLREAMRRVMEIHRRTSFAPGDKVHTLLWDTGNIINAALGEPAAGEGK